MKKLPVVALWSEAGGHVADQLPTKAVLPGCPNQRHRFIIAGPVRPVPTQRNAHTLQQLVNGSLRNTVTKQSKLSAAGKTDDKHP